MKETMKNTKDTDKIKAISKEMISILNLGSSPVGVRFLEDSEQKPEGAEILEKHRYCQALMKARNGANVILTGEEISCPAAASAFGFRPLPEKLESGKGLIGFGIVSDPAVGKKMFEGMSKLKSGQIQYLHIFPLNQAEYIPDIVIVEDDPEKLMWIALAYLHATGGERIQSSTAILQATCVDATIIPFLSQRLNFVYGCYGCRDATDLGEHEAVMGFPGSMLPEIIEHLKYLGKKAIPRSRSKGALSLLEGKDVEVKSC
ncbi:putative ArCR [anaerobic digester metagenome]